MVLESNVEIPKKIPEVEDLSYWERLKIIKMNSQQRRLERYRFIYTWKVIEGLLPDPGPDLQKMENGANAISGSFLFVQKIFVCGEVFQHEHNKTKGIYAYFRRFQDTVGNS